MQSIGIEDHQNLEIHCPFCGALAISPDGLEQCEHTLLHASNEGGFEYVNPVLGFGVEVDLDDLSIDEFIVNIDRPSAILINIFQPSPGNFCGYVAFDLVE